MAEIINLRRIKRRAARDAAAHDAATARLQHGRSKSERTMTASVAKIQGRTLDGAFLDHSDRDGEVSE